MLSVVQVPVNLREGWSNVSQEGMEEEIGVMVRGSSFPSMKVVAGMVYSKRTFRSSWKSGILFKIAGL